MPFSKFTHTHAMQRELYTERVLADFFLEGPVSYDAMMLDDACDTIPHDDEDQEDEALVPSLLDEPTTLFLCILSILWYTIFTVVGIF